jgi:hypothetical protein
MLETIKLRRNMYFIIKNPNIHFYIIINPKIHFYIIKNPKIHFCIIINQKIHFCIITRKYKLIDNTNLYFKKPFSVDNTNFVSIRLFLLFVFQYTKKRRSREWYFYTVYERAYSVIFKYFHPVCLGTFNFLKSLTL